MRFRIELSGLTTLKFVLERRRRTKVFLWFHTEWWEHVGYFEKIEEARARYEELKDLPEYLE
jgi:hypothetical protein